MTNEKMNFADLKLIEKDLHRELTDNEAMIGYTKGWRELLKFMGLTDEKYVAYRRLVELLITYCTKDSVEFEKLRRSKDYADAFALLGDFINACNKQDDEFVPLKDEPEEEEDELTVEDVVEYIFNNVPETEKFWLEEYVKLDPKLEVIKKYISDLFDDDEEHECDEEVGNALDVIKDAVVEKTAARLVKEGKAEKLPKVLLDEVCDYVENTWTNYTMRVVNGVISLKKF